MRTSAPLMARTGINTYKPHVVKMMERRLGAKEPLECAKEVGEVLMCWSTIFVTANSSYDPFKCKKIEETLLKCQLSMESSSMKKQRKSMKASIIHQVLTIANNSTNTTNFRPKK